MASVTIAQVKKRFGATDILHGVDISIPDGSLNWVPVMVRVPLMGAVVGEIAVTLNTGSGVSLLLQATNATDRPSKRSSEYCQFLRSCIR